MVSRSKGADYIDLYSVHTTGTRSLRAKRSGENWMTGSTGKSGHAVTRRIAGIPAPRTGGGLRWISGKLLVSAVDRKGLRPGIRRRTTSLPSGTLASGLSLCLL